MSLSATYLTGVKKHGHGKSKMFVYFIQGQTTRLIKIGQTAGSVSNRLQEIQSNSPDKLEVLKAIEASRRAEQFLHEKFEPFRSHGEWFYPSGVLMRFIESIDDRKLISHIDRFYHNLENLLTEINMSSRKLSKLTGVNEIMIHKYRNGKATPRKKNLKAIADFFEVEVSELFK